MSVTTLLGGGAWLTLQLWGREPGRSAIGSDRLAPIAGGCRGNADCPPAQACVVDRNRILKCHPSECDDDTQCSSRHVCRQVLSILGEPGVNLCIPVGQQK